MNLLHIGITACSLSAFHFTPSAACRRRRASFLDNFDNRVVNCFNSPYEDRQR